MSRKLEFFFDYVSPYSHIANAAVKQAISRDGIDVVYRPIFLGGVMQATGNRPPGTVEAKARYMDQDLARCARRYGIAIKMNPHFPMNTRGLTRATLGLSGNPDRQAAFIETCFELCWGEEQIDPGDMAALGAALETRGYDSKEILALATAEENKAALRENTEEAVRRGVFGSPSFFVGEELFFGHDRLDFAIDALKRD